MTEWLTSFPLTQYIQEQTKKHVCKAIRTGPVPQHIGFIMDGNRTYAKRKHIEAKEGHSAGFDSMSKILEVCYDCGVKSVTVFAFSIENFKRSNYEINWLMELAKTKFKQVVGNGELCEQFGIKIKILGDLNLLPLDLRKVLLEAQEITKNNSRAVLNVCWSYTSRHDMTQSIQQIVGMFDGNKIIDSKKNKSIDNIKNIDEDLISKKLYTGDSPPLDLLIRTSGVHRLSDFMLWECCREGCTIEIIDVLWPQFSALNMVWLLVKWSFQKTYNSNKNNNIII